MAGTTPKIEVRIASLRPVSWFCLKFIEAAFIRL